MHLIKDKHKNVLHLSVINCDMIQDMGPQLSMLPIFTWKTESLTKNNIELMTIVDLCVFDSNKRQMILNT